MGEFFSKKDIIALKRRGDRLILQREISLEIREKNRNIGVALLTTIWHEKVGDKARKREGLKMKKWKRLKKNETHKYLKPEEGLRWSNEKS